MPPLNPLYPATLTFDPPEKVANWRPLLNWFLAIPHFVILYALRILSQVVGLISWFVILFTGELPESFANIQSMYLRYETRVFMFWTFMCELTGRNRLTVAFRIILVIPQLIALFVLDLVAFAVTVVAFFAVLFTGRWPEGMRTLVLNIARWYLRVEAYYLLLLDEYPPFALESAAT
jgi:Domain of unknown function (DUF4389)